MATCSWNTQKWKKCGSVARILLLKWPWEPLPLRVLEYIWLLISLLLLTELAISESEGNHTQTIMASRTFLTHSARALFQQISYYHILWANSMLLAELQCICSVLILAFDYVVDATVCCPDPFWSPKYIFLCCQVCYLLKIHSWLPPWELPLA